MSFLDRIRTANRYEHSAYRPFVVAGTRVGYIKAITAETLRAWPEVFSVGEDQVTLSAQLDRQDATAAGGYHRRQTEDAHQRRKKEAAQQPLGQAAYGQAGGGSDLSRAGFTVFAITP